jgi:hypothetical protein
MVLVLLAPLGLCGCRSSATVSGKVSYNGVPLKGGNVTFVNSAGKPSVSTAIKEDGSYTLAKVPVGTVKIAVETASLNRPRKVQGPSYRPPPGQTAPGGFAASNAVDVTRLFVAIPAHYADPEKSGLTCTVKGGKQDHPIDLK